MIDLISHGLDLRKKLIASSRDNPQVIRTVSAERIRYQSTYSAISAESAAMSKNNLEYGSENEPKVGVVADSADIAERQSRQTHTIADDLRKNCGLNTTMINKSPKDSLKTVVCNDCEHFSPDEIGDGIGIGSCAIGIRSTKIEGYITMPLYRYSDRYCDKFNKLMK